MTERVKRSVPLRVNVSPQLASTLRDIAANRDVSVAQVLRHALRDYALRESERKGWS